VKLMVGCLKRLTCLGSSKSRGWGQVRLTAEPTVEELVAPGVEAAVPAQGPLVLRLLLTNLEPLNLTATAEAGHLVAGESFIGGSRLRGAILRWLSDHGGRELANDLVKHGAFDVGNGYCVPWELKDVSEALTTLEVMPLPRTIRQPKSGQREKDVAYDGRLPW